MSHPRNVKGILAAAEAKSQDTLLRTEKAIQELLRQGKPINFNTVSQTAQVSVAWCYRNERLCERIKQLRQQEQLKKRQLIPPQERPSDASKDSMIMTLKLRIKELFSENADLRKQLEVVYGQLASQKN
jgi:hypothetical protein